MVVTEEVVLSLYKDRNSNNYESIWSVSADNILDIQMMEKSVAIVLKQEQYL